MANRRNVLITVGALVVALLAAVVVWRLGSGGDGGETADPKPTETTEPGVTATTTGTTFPAATAQPEPAFPTERDALSWPFAADSIWNLPLGEAATRVPAGMSLPENGVSVDEDILILEPTAPKVDVVTHDAGWDAQANRCQDLTGTALFSDVPIPTDFVTDPGFLGATPNHAAAILLADGDTVVQTQPLHRCSAGGPAVSQYGYTQDSLHSGSGIPGAHGGSQMSSLGGTVRLGELVPGGALRHALKINIDCAAFCSYDSADADAKPGFRWPATAADFEAPERYAGTVPALQMGALLALPAGFNADQLRTEPARMIARTLMRYGAYVVDDTRYPIFALTTEWSPDGRVIDEFESAWGFSMHDAADPGCTDESAACAWVQDFDDMLSALEVIDNNGPTSVGGGGSRLTACAPAFAVGGAGGAGGASTTTGPATTTGPTTTTPSATSAAGASTADPATSATSLPVSSVPGNAADQTLAPATVTTATTIAGPPGCSPT